jgi:hypothetical protein
MIFEDLKTVCDLLNVLLTVHHSSYVSIVKPT